MMLCRIVIVTAGQTDAADVKLAAGPADEWTALFDRRSVTVDGWLAADGIYTASLDGNDSFASAGSETNTFFIFSDTLVGRSDENGKTIGAKMSNHTSAILSGNTPDPANMTFVLGRGGSGDITKSIFTDERMWMFDCFVTGGSVYIVAFPPDDAMKPSRIDLIKVPVQNGAM